MPAFTVKLNYIYKDSFRDQISTFAVKFRPNSEWFAQKSPNSDKVRKFGPNWGHCINQLIIICYTALHDKYPLQYKC